jgi:uncharacterized membrane protein
MISSIPIGANVICTDGSGGKSTAAIVDPITRKLTHIAVVEQSVLHGEERLVPIDRVTKTTREEIHLNCTKDEVLGMEPFTRTHYLETDRGAEGYAYSLPYMTTYPDMMMSPELSYLTVQDQLVPEGEIAIHRGMAVEATDGPVGQVGELLIDPESGQITHFLLMKGLGGGKKEIAIQVATIDHVDEDTIHLKIAKDQVKQLAALPVKREWDEVYATELELMVWVYGEKDRARQALDKVHELSEQNDIDILNATVIEKDLDGNTRVNEEKKGKSKRRVGLGLALGGLAGLLVGPVALVAGAIAGAAAGKKSAKKFEVGFSKENLRILNETLAPGGSALFLLVEHRWFNALQVELAETGGQLIYERLANITFDELVGKLSAGEKAG